MTGTEINLRTGLTGKYTD